MLKKMEGQVVQVYWLLFTLSLRGILAGDWSVHLPASPVCAVIGSSVILPCSYDYPQSSNGTVGAGQVSSQGRGGDEGQRYRVLSEIWCLENSRCITPRYVFHSAGILPDPSYQNRVKYLGQAGTKNCSLKISNLRKSDSGTYVFYLITSHPTQKMPEQRGIQLLVADSPRAVTTAVNPSSGISAGVVVRLSCCSPSASLCSRFPGTMVQPVVQQQTKVFIRHDKPWPHTQEKAPPLEAPTSLWRNTGSTAVWLATVMVHRL